MRTQSDAPGCGRSRLAERRTIWQLCGARRKPGPPSRHAPHL